MRHAYIALLFFLVVSPAAYAQTPEVYATKEGAIQGYDAVAYFTENKPVKGLKNFMFTYQQQDWYFSSAENLEKFKSSPATYTPQFGGYCAFGMSRGYKAKTDPQAWSIVDGKLYLNYNLDVRKIWNEKQEALIEKANQNWPTVKQSEFKQD